VMLPTIVAPIATNATWSQKEKTKTS
jgi:hypothetical protein